MLCSTAGLRRELKSGMLRPQTLHKALATGQQLSGQSRRVLRSAMAAASSVDGAAAAEVRRRRSFRLEPAATV